ncbi:MAG: hypothetical protein KGL94_14210 [Acidobacteriota bacterium]|nr:hypothetical protein [Acidobacteriota bacterium]
MRHVLPWLAGWLAFFWLWLLLAGDWNRIEWIGAASCATVAASLGELARTRAAVELRVPWRALAASRGALPRVLPDFAIVMWALVRPPRGRTHTRKTDVRGSRAWTNYAANLSPNAFVIDIDDEHVTLHDLVMNRKSESPA